MKIERGEHALGAHAAGVELFRYVFRPETTPFEGPKPYLHPVRTLAGDIVTAFRPHDHRWHKGIQMTASDVSGENFWGGGTYVRDQGYVDLPNVGVMRHEQFVNVLDDRIEEWLTWRTQAGEHWLDERRELIVRVGAEAWSLDFATSLTNVCGAHLRFGSPTTSGRPLAGYSGLFWRGPRSFTDGEIIAADGQGGPEMMGRPARWLAYVGAFDEVDRHATLMFFDGPGYDGNWFVRSTPFPAVNPSLAFWEEMTLPAGETLNLRYRIVIADGAWDRTRLETYAKEHPW